jgi:NADH dehydrogenase
MREFASFSLEPIVPDKDIKITLIEAAPKILPALPERLSDAVMRLLRNLNVAVIAGDRVTEISAQGVRTASGREVLAELVVWAAGIRAPDFLRGLAGLESNHINQLVVTPTLQATRDENIRSE